MKRKSRKKSSFKKYLKWALWAFLGFLIFVLFSFSKLLTFVPDLPSLIGFPGESKNYILVAQNPSELRPTGGFVTAYVVVQFRNGVLDNVDFHDVYGVIDDHPFVEPPYPLGELLAHEHYSGHTFRDANTYADFAQSSEELIKFFNITKPQIEIDGVVAINYSLFEEVIDVLGGIEFEGHILTKQNLFEWLEHRINNVDRHNIEQIFSRKQFLQPVLYATIKKALLNPSVWDDLDNLALQALDNKDVQLYMRDEDLQRKYLKRGWTGTWPQAKDADFFAVVESNLGGMKSNRYITRTIDHNVYIEPQGESFALRANTEIEIHHHGIDNIPLSGDYTSFLRLYTPKGSKLLSNQSDTLEYEEGSHQVFAKKTALKPGEKITLNFDYSIPDNALVNGKYRLYIPKQSSTKDLYSLTIHGPRGTSIKSNDFDLSENTAFFKGLLEKDMLFELELLPDQLSPLVIFQKMTSLRTATIHFNEPVRLRDTGESHFEMKDLNFNNEHTDEVVVVGSKISRENLRVIDISFQGLTKQVEERYKLSISGVEDLNGNLINPQPTEITLIQRNL